MLSKAAWQRVGKYRRAGVLVPLFLVYSKKSVGIGDLEDLKLLVDWCAKTGNSILQLLPMTEIGSTFCPYDAISSFALESTYISFEALPAKDKKLISARISSARKMFPAGKSHVNYAIKSQKEDLLWDAYQKNRSRHPEGLKKFEEENRYWLDDFAAFKILKKYHAGLPWYEWKDGYKNRDKDALRVFQSEHREEIAFQKWLQWTAFNQFRSVKDYAGSKKVKICGDLPILISRDSADVWAHPQFFKLDFAAGAPPDMYCAKGQRWGVPTYDWAAISRDGYRYVKEKLKFAENFYDILRVDHVIGLFRIWSIPYNDPMENEGLNGFFDPRDENSWEEHGKRILSVMLKNTNMLLSAEDLGMIPKVCPETLKGFGISGNDVQRWVKDWKVKHDFLDPKEYRLFAVAMLSTHDTTNWAAWWENEAGTLDEALFMRKARERGIDYNTVKGHLFDPVRSKHGRLRWRDDIASSEILADILGRKKEEIADFIEMYENTYREKEKLWKHLKMKGPMREKANPKIISAALDITLKSRSVFCIELIIDYLLLAGVFKGDPYQYRINRPGTVSRENWSLVMPISLEDLLKNKICKDIRAKIRAGDRI